MFKTVNNVILIKGFGIKFLSFYRWLGETNKQEAFFLFLGFELQRLP